MSLQEWAEAERSRSAISPEVWQANVRLYEGWLATEMFFAANHLAEEERWLLKRYRHLERGLWLVEGETLVPRPLVPYAKPYTARSNREGKLIKYENPPRLPAYPILPRLPGRTWRQVLDDPSIPVAIVEGAKKAMSLVSHGLAAVAIRGITQWHAAGERGPWLEIALLAKGRRIYLFPDQDEKVRTRSDVLNQNRRLGQALRRLGAEVRVVLWDGALGKGIDDVLAAAPDPRAWLQQAVAGAAELETLGRLAEVAKAKRLLSQEPLPAWVEQVGEHVGELQVPEGRVFWLDAPMGSGKTTALGQAARRWIAAGGQVAVFSPLNSLGQQTAQRWDLPHIHDYVPQDAASLRFDVDVRGGVVACINSAERVEAALDPERRLLVIIDEANQVLADAAAGQTLRDKWSAKLGTFARLLTRAAAVVAAEANLWPSSVELLTQLTGLPQAGYRLRRPAGESWSVTQYCGPVSALRSEVAERLRQGQRLLLVTTSQREARRWEAWAEQAGVNRVWRIDSETNDCGRYREFFWDPNRWLEEHRPNLLVMSPSGKTGLSIEHPTAFDAVVGIFPSLDTDTCMQLLGRYRPPVPRLVWRPEFIQPGPDEDGNLVRVRAALYRELSAYGGEAQALNDPWVKFFLATGQRRWAQKVAARESLHWALMAAGHRVTYVSPGADEAMNRTFQDIDQQLRERDATQAAAILLQGYQTVEWAREVLEAVDSSHFARLTARKVLLRHEFPDLNWDDPRTWLAAVYGKNPLRRQVQRWVGCLYLEAARQQALAKAQSLLAATPTPAHRLPRELFDWGLAARFRPLVLKLLEQGYVHPEGEVESQIYELALQYRSDIARYWKLHVKPGQSVTCVVNKVLKRLGLRTQRERNLRLANQRRAWLYRIVLPYLWKEMVQAYQRHLQERGWKPDPDAAAGPPATDLNLPVEDPPAYDPPPNLELRWVL